MIVPIAHDFACPWCWIGLFQAKDLKRQFDVQFEWRAYEIFPEEMAFGEYKPSSDPPNKPKTPSRFQLAIAAQRMTSPTNRGPANIRSHKAHEAVEFINVKTRQTDEFVEAIYRAYYEQAADIDNVDVLVDIARPFTKEVDALTEAIKSKRFKSEIIAFDEPAYATGIYNVPTFRIGGELYAEQPYTVLEKAMQNAMVKR